MEQIGKYLQTTMNKKGIGKEALSAQICYYAKEISDGLFTPISFSRYELKVQSSSSSAATEIQMIKEDIIEKINTKLGRKLVRSIRILNIS